MTRPSRLHYAVHALLVSSLLAALAPAAIAAPPVLTVPGAQSVAERQTLQFGVSAYDPDGQSVELYASNVPSGAAFTDNRNNTGTFTWIPATGQAGSYLVGFLADDTFGGTDSRTVAIDVYTMNTPPVLGQIADLTVDPGSMAIISVWATDDDQDPLAFTASGLPGFGQLTDYGDGTASLVFTPSVAEPGGVYGVTVTVSDGKDPVAQTFHLTVSGAEQMHPPVLDPVEDVTVAEGSEVAVEVRASDADGDPLTWTSALPPFGSFSVLSSDPGASTARAAFLPGPCDAGDHAASVSASDGGASSSATFTVHVTDVPRTPVWTAPEAGTVVATVVGGSFDVDLSGTDPDQACGGPAPLFSILSSDAGDALSLTLLPGSGGSATLHGISNGPAGEFHVTLRLTDGANPDRHADRTIAVVAQEAARTAGTRAWTRPKMIHLWLGSWWQHFYLETGAADPSEIDPSTVRVTAWEGAGEGGDAAAEAGRSVPGTDSDLNGLKELRFDVARKDLERLFSRLTEATEGTITVTAALRNGEPLRASFRARVIPDRKRALKRCGPNPLNPEAIVEIVTESPGPLRVMVFDIQGRMVRVLADEANVPAGSRELTFDGRDDRGRTLRAGRYFLRVESVAGLDSAAMTILP